MKAIKVSLLTLALLSAGMTGFVIKSSFGTLGARPRCPVCNETPNAVRPPNHRRNTVATLYCENGHEWAQ